MKTVEDVLAEIQEPPRRGAGKALRFALGAFAVAAGLGGITALVSNYGIGLLIKAGISQSAAAPVPAPRAAPAASQGRNTAVYHADPSGHFFVDAEVNGATLRFLVDTGASFVALTPDDARAAGIMPGALTFSGVAHTANGDARVAPTTLREVRLDQLEIRDVQAAVMERPMPISLLGMSFLSRLQRYSIEDGTLTIEW